MSDQAEGLRNLAQVNPQFSHESWCPPTLVIGSGKGGVGKSVLSVLIGTSFARTGARVLLLDGDFNLGNLHILLGVQPVARVETLLHGDATPGDLVIPVSENLFLLPSDSGGEILHTLGSIDRARLYHRLVTISDQYDVVIVDAGAGIESMIRCASVRACQPIVVTVPEPAALADAYAVIKIINLQLRGVGVSVLVNRVSGDLQGHAAFDRLNAASERFLQTPLKYIGALRDDTALQGAVRSATPFWSESDGVSHAIHPIVEQMRTAFGMEMTLSSTAVENS